VGNHWLPSELKHETVTFKFVMKDFEWEPAEFRSPPKSFWIYVGDQTAPTAHTEVSISDCQPY
jgi:hypothetical protein